MILYEGDTFEKDGEEYIIRFINASSNKFEVRAEPKAGWRVYEVVGMHDMYYVDFKDEYKRLYECQDMVGFGGVQFDEQSDDNWTPVHVGYTARGDKQPAVPIRARFWEDNGGVT
jgi:hypothetical protein